MNRFSLIIIFFYAFIAASSGQKYYSKTARVHFISEAPIDTISADNNNGYVIFDEATGHFEFSVLIKGFTFQKALMQEHFNENYMESDNYPKAIYKGNIVDWPNIHMITNHVYQVNVDGLLTLHGVTRPYKYQASLTRKPSGVSANASFDITIADHNIQIPKVVKNNISKTVHVSVKTDMVLMK